MLLCADLPVNVGVLLEQTGSMLKRELMARNDVAPARFISRTVRLARRRTPLLPQSRVQRTRAACDQLSGSFRVVHRACRNRLSQRNSKLRQWATISGERASRARRAQSVA